MKQKWGREGYAGEWPSSKPVWTIAAFFLALAAAAAIYAYRYERVWTPLQRFYLTQYLASGTNPIRKSSRYLLLNTVDKKGSWRLSDMVARRKMDRRQQRKNLLGNPGTDGTFSDILAW